MFLESTNDHVDHRIFVERADLLSAGIPRFGEGSFIVF